MFEQNVAQVLERIGPDDVVLDIGGWARCFNRANYVMDGGPYETHGTWYWEQYRLGPQGGDVEHFNADRWIRRDICHHDPFPFEDKSIDFCICSHTLEDIRDPSWVCREINRVAKRGYIEIPSPVFEFTRDREPSDPVGLSHHRWIVDVRDDFIAFFPKHHYIHGDPRHSLPRSIGMAVPPERQVSWLFWEGELHAGELPWSKDDVAEMVISVWMRETGESRDDVLRQIAAYAESQERLKDRDRVADSKNQLDRENELNARIADLERQLADAHRLGGELEARLDQFSDLGPTAIDVTLRLRRASRRYPKLSSIVKQVIRVA